ncbi:MAG: hypothetical protein QOH57_1369 [Mycobacterium sp.]|jgi:hypothetical protein|nr:hypothetical protein [Mycobacterium sp.]
MRSRRIGVDEAWGRAGQELHARLIEESSAQARFDLIKAFLVSRAQRSPARQPIVLPSHVPVAGQKYPIQSGSACA